MSALFLRPDADQSDGSWLNESSSGTNLFASVDETSFSDSDYIQSSTTVGDKIRLQISNPGTVVSGPMIIRYRGKRGSGNAAAGVTGRLFEGTTQRATWQQGVDDTLTTYTYTLTSGEFTSITDFNNLFVEFEYINAWWLANASVDLLFTTAQYYDSSAGGGGQAVTTYLSCTRASVGYAKTSTGTLTSFGTNTLRITDNGLLVEDGRTNFSYPSQAVSGGVTWTATNLTVADNATTAPDGTTTAASLTVIASASDNFLTNTGGGAPRALTTAPFAFAIYVKRSTCDWIRVYVSDHGGNNLGTWINLNTGALGSTQLGGTGVIDTRTVETLANGWYRIIVTGHLSAGSSGWDFNLTPSSADGSQQGTAGQVLYIWGAQFEDGSFISSYIPTSGAAATRAADLVTCISNLATVLTTSPSSGVVDCMTPVAAASLTNASIISDSVGSNAFLCIGNDSQLRTTNVSTGGGALLATNLGGSTLFSTGVKVGYAITNGTSRSLVGGGGTVATDSNTAAYLPLYGNAVLGVTYPTFITQRRLTVWNSRLADATLQAQTAP